MNWGSLRKTVALYYATWVIFNRSPRRDELMKYLNVTSASTVWKRTNFLIQEGVLKRDGVLKVRIVSELSPPLTTDEKEDACNFMANAYRSGLADVSLTMMEREQRMDPNGDAGEAQTRAEYRQSRRLIPLTSGNNKRSELCEFPLWGPGDRGKEYCGREICVVQGKRKPYCQKHWRQCILNWDQMERGVSYRSTKGNFLLGRRASRY